MKMKHLAIGLAALFLVACSKPEKARTETSSKPATVARDPKAPLIPKPREAEPFASPYMEKLAANLVGGDGEPVNPQDYTAAKQTLVYFSASWCGPCKVFTPKLVEEYYRLRAAGIQVVLANKDKTKEDMMNYMSSFNHPWPGICPETLEAKTVDFSEFEEKGIPSLALLDADGKLVKKGIAPKLFEEILGDLDK